MPDQLVIYGGSNIIGPVTFTSSSYSPVLTGFVLSYNPNTGVTTYMSTASISGGGGGGGGTPGGSPTQIQFNNAGAFGGVPTLTFDGSTLRATGSFNGTLVGSLTGTASWATNVVNGGGGGTINTSSLATTGSNTFRGNQTISGSVTITSSLNVFGGELVVNSNGVNIGNLVGDSHTITGSFAIAGNQIVNGTVSASGNITGNVIGNLTGTASYASNADLLDGINSTRFATTGSNTFVGNQVVSGSLIVTQNLTIFGTASITQVSESQLNIGTNLITVATNSPFVRFGGLAIIDSGSSPLGSGSILFDSVQDEFIFVHRGNGTNVTSSHFLVGPETYDSLGNETYIAQNRLIKSQGNEHVAATNITDTGTIVSINSNTQLTGSLNISGSTTLIGNETITGSLSISGSLVTRFVTSSVTYTASISDSTIDLTGNVTASLYSVVGNRGRQLVIKNGGTGVVTVDAHTTETIDGQLTRRLGSYESLILQADGISDWGILNKTPCVIPMAHDAQVTVDDGTTYYWGNQIFGPPSSVSDISRQQTALVSGWATDVTLLVSVAGTTATSDNSTLVFVNVTTGTTTTLTTALKHNVNNQLLSFSLSPAVQITKGDRLEFRWSTPTWGTNPGSVRHLAQVLVQ